jgi:hypothetical protein
MRRCNVGNHRLLLPSRAWVSRSLCEAGSPGGGTARNSPRIQVGVTHSAATAPLLQPHTTTSQIARRPLYHAPLSLTYGFLSPAIFNLHPLSFRCHLPLLHSAPDKTIRRHISANASLRDGQPHTQTHTRRDTSSQLPTACSKLSRVCQRHAGPR